MPRSRKADPSDVVAPEIPDDLRRRDPPQNDHTAVLPEADELHGVPGISPSEDGGVDQHPIHDEDLDDLDPKDFEDMADEIEDLENEEAGPEEDESGRG